MSVDRPMRHALAALFLIAALFTAMNRIVASAPMGDWLLPLILFLIGIALAFAPSINWFQPQPESEPEPAASPTTYIVSAQPVPRLQTMTIRPDPESAESTMPFMEAGTPLTRLESDPVPQITFDAAPDTEPGHSAVAPGADDPTEVPYELTAEQRESAAVSSDDLTRIKGIGPKSAAALKAADVDSFHKLANTTSEALQAILTGAGVRLVGNVDSWTDQAAYAERGDWAGLENFNKQGGSPDGD